MMLELISNLHIISYTLLKELCNYQSIQEIL